MREINKKTKVLALIIVTLFSLSTALHSTIAEKPDTKMVETVVGSYTIDGTTINFVSHLNGIIKWIVEPTGYVEWEGGMIPVDGEFWVKQGSLEHDRIFSKDSRISVTSISSSYTGTFEIVAVPSPQPGSPWIWPPHMPMPRDGIMNSVNLIKEYGEIGTSKGHTVIRYVDGVPQVLMTKSLPPPSPPGKISTLTGTIRDWGLDEDGNSLYDCLVVSVEARIRTSGFFYLGIIGLEDSNGGLIDVNKITYQYLDAGTQFIDIMLEGPVIHDSGLNPSRVYLIILNDESGSNPNDLRDVLLSREYSCEEFEGWPASLTGAISDVGVKTDANPWYDYLQISVEVEVTEQGNYVISASGLLDNAYNFTYYLHDSKLVNLDVGIQTVNLTYNGPTIRASMINPWYIESIYLTDENGFMLDSVSMVPLPTKYTWSQFDPPGARFIIQPLNDRGVDADADLKYEYLEVGTTLGVLENGTYTVQAMLGDSNGSFIAVGSSTMYIVKPPPFTQLATIQFEGLMIYNSGLNPSKILSMELFDENNNFIGQSSGGTLTRTCSYTEFDSGFS